MSIKVPLEIPHDKWQHILVGLCIYALCSLMFRLPPRLAFLVVAFIALSKELLWDLALGKGEASVMDFFATVTVPAMIALYTTTE
jgi:hypothetical protein